MELSRAIFEKDAFTMAKKGFEAFVEDSTGVKKYFTYPDVGDSVQVTGNGDYELSADQRAAAFQLTYDAPSGTYPIRLDRPMWPRRKK